MPKLLPLCLLIIAALFPPVLFAEAGPSPAPRDLFTVHSFSTLLTAPENFPVEEKANSFEALAKLMAAQKIVGWGTGKPVETKQPNWESFGFTGVTGYAALPGSEEKITCGLDFQVTYQDRTESTVMAKIAMNDNRATKDGADNVFLVNALLKKGVFQLIKLGPPQDHEQAWLALRADDFSEKAEMIPVQSGITLPADHHFDLKFTAADGQQIDTAKMRGKVILVDYWATWCGPCIAAMPRLAELYAQYHPRGLEIIGVNLDEERGPMDSYLKKHPHPWPQSVSAPGGRNPLFDSLNVQGIPLFLLIDKKGLATPIDARNPDTEDRIEALLKA